MYRFFSPMGNILSQFIGFKMLKIIVFSAFTFFYLLVILVTLYFDGALRKTTQVCEIRKGKKQE